MKKLRAFTLLEIVIALAILVIGLVGILSLFPVGFQASKKATDLTEATLYAQQKIEDLKKDGYGSATVGTTTGTFKLPDGITNSRFSWNLQVDDNSTDATLPPGLKRIELTVDWTEGGKSFNEKFVTYIAKLKP